MRGLFSAVLPVDAEDVLDRDLVMSLHAFLDPYQNLPRDPDARILVERLAA